MQDDDTTNRYVELNAIHAMLRFAAARAEELDAGPLEHAIDRARKIARAEIQRCKTPELFETDLPNEPSKRRER